MPPYTSDVHIKILYSAARMGFHDRRSIDMTTKYVPGASLVRTAVVFCFFSVSSILILLQPPKSYGQEAPSPEAPSPPDAGSGPATDPIPVLVPALRLHLEF